MLTHVEITGTKSGIAALRKWEFSQKFQNTHLIQK